MTDLLPRLERWIAWIRVGAVAFALLQVGLVPTVEPYPDGYLAAAWLTTAALAVGALFFLVLSRRALSRRAATAVGVAALAFDTAICSAFVLIYSFETGTPIRQLLVVVLVEAAIRYGLAGGLALPFALAPVFAAFEGMRDDRTAYDWGNVSFSVGVLLIIGLFVGWLVQRLWRQSELVESRAEEAERLRDELGRRVDVLDATNRVARSLGSSLDLDEAFTVFIRELRGLIRFDRVAIVLHDNEALRVMAAAGTGADDVLPPGTRIPPGPLAQEILQTGQTLYRRDMSEGPKYEEERELLELGLRSRIAAPIMLGARPTGIFGVVRSEPDAFSGDEIELVTLLGRLVATAVQNIRAYEAERSTVEELRRLSALRADFVSLVSHELRSPMAAVIGSARTLQQRWRSLTPEQRESFLALIADETNRLAGLIGDVLDTSRIEAGTFTYTFGEVDVADLVRESVAAAELAQDEVRVAAQTTDPLPAIRGDRERLRQVLMNLIENAVKFTSAGGEVAVAAYPAGGEVRIEVTDQGPGISSDHVKLIFEKFGRVTTPGKVRPGSGLGLFIARSITEAHGGHIDVHSQPGGGATFTVVLPTN